MSMNSNCLHEYRKVNVLIYRGKAERSIYLYGRVTDTETNEVIIAASAKYVSDMIKERGYQIVNFEVEE